MILRSDFNLIFWIILEVKGQWHCSIFLVHTRINRLSFRAISYIIIYIINAKCCKVINSTRWKNSIQTSESMGGALDPPISKNLLRNRHRWTLKSSSRPTYSSKLPKLDWCMILLFVFYIRDILKYRKRSKMKLSAAEATWNPALLFSTGVCMNPHTITKS